MPNAPKTHKPPRADCPEHVPACMQRARTSSRGYGWRWQKAREAYLAGRPLCVQCLAKGVVFGGSRKNPMVVDHIVPHKGDSGLMWDRGNWQSLCATCHNRKTRIENRQGRQ